MPITGLGYTHHPHAPRAQAVSSGDEAGLKPNDCAEVHYRVRPMGLPFGRKIMQIRPRFQPPRT